MLYLILFFIFLFGLTIGSFINCLIWRLHENEKTWTSLFRGKGKSRSYCPKCKKHIAWYDNIPVISFFILRGKCRKCRKSISWQYPIVELITGLLFVVAFLWNQESGIRNQELFLNSINGLIPNSLFLINLIRDWFIIAVMIIIFIYDLRWYLILDIVTLPACVVVFILNLMLGISWQNLLFSGIIGGSFFLMQFLISRGKWIGGGDIRLGLLMGLALGWPNVILAILLGYIIGSVVGIGLLISKKKKWSSKLPLGVFLSASTIITIFWGSEIINWYFNILL